MDFPTGATPQSMAVGDLNGDGHVDVATAGGGSIGSVSVLLGNGDGTLDAYTQLPTGSVPVSVSIGDLDGDRLDLVTANQSTSNSHLQRARG